MWYLCYFLHRLLDYRLPEVESLAKVFSGKEGFEVRWKQSPDHHPDSPFYYVWLPSDDIARKIASRSVLVKGIFEIWGEGSNYEVLQTSIESYPEEKMAPFLAEDQSFKIVVDAFGKVFSFEEQTERIKSLTYIPWKGHVDLKNPQQRFWIIETDGFAINNGLPPVCKKSIIFGREIGVADRKSVVKYELSRRKYLGPTAMDAEIALLMANQALVQRGKLVYDPFVGTGSILVGAAHYGAMTMGADIDIRVIRDGKGPDRNVWSNFKQNHTDYKRRRKDHATSLDWPSKVLSSSPDEVVEYSFSRAFASLELLGFEVIHLDGGRRQYDLPQPLGLIRADNNLRPWRPDLREVFDAIICDPPYGVRAGGRKSGGRRVLNGTKDPYIISEGKRHDHIPSTAPYTLEECLHDLMDMAAQLLVTGGRLVFFYPAPRDECTVEHLPSHPCFTLIANSEQILSTRYSRCLLTMEKTGRYTDEIAAKAKETHHVFKINHAQIVEKDRENRLHSVVFSSLDTSLEALELSETRPRYRGKYV